MAKCVHWERALGFLTASQHTSLTQKDSRPYQKPSNYFLFHFPSAHQIRTHLGNVTRRKRERKENNKKTAARFSTTNTVGRVCETCHKSTADRNVLFFVWFLESFKFQLVLCAKSTGLYKYIWVKIDRWEKLARPCQSQRPLLCVCQWKNSHSCFTKIRVFYSKMKTRNQRVRIRPLVSHPVCDLIKRYSWLPAS